MSWAAALIGPDVPPAPPPTRSWSTWDWPAASLQPRPGYPVCAGHAGWLRAGTVGESRPGTQVLMRGPRGRHQGRSEFLPRGSRSALWRRGRTLYWVLPLAGPICSSPGGGGGISRGHLAPAVTHLGENGKIQESRGQACDPSSGTALSESHGSLVSPRRTCVLGAPAVAQRGGCYFGF